MIRHTGTEYERSRYVPATEIAKSVRAKIKAAVKSGELPAGLKYRVRSESYAGGQSVNINLVGPDGNGEAWAMRPVDPSRQEDAAAYHHGRTEVYTDEALRIARLVESYGKAHTREDVDSMVDYFNVSCYVFVHVGEGGRCI